jgi:hypothetical protein
VSLRRSLATGSLGALALVGTGALLSVGGAQAAPRVVECQHPLTTGWEASNLRHVSAKVACRVVRHLGHWEQKPGNIRRLYKCVGPGKHTAVLKLHSFEGWRLSLSRAGRFRMARGRASFNVSGTDFPINCS